jgi:hypothetical protein
MVNNFTNNKKAKNNFPHWTHKHTITYDDENPEPSLGQAHKCGWVKPVNNLISNANTYIHKR